MSSHVTACMRIHVLFSSCPLWVTHDPRLRRAGGAPHVGTRGTPGSAGATGAMEAFTKTGRPGKTQNGMLREPGLQGGFPSGQGPQPGPRDHPLLRVRLGWREDLPEGGAPRSGRSGLGWGLTHQSCSFTRRPSSRMVVVL